MHRFEKIGWTLIVGMFALLWGLWFGVTVGKVIRHFLPKEVVVKEVPLLEAAGEVAQQWRDETGRLDRLWVAICLVESGGDPKCPAGDGGKAIGIAQIHPIMVADCNQILGRDAFDLEDRKDPNLSKQMFKVFAQHYGLNRDRSDEWIARAWNGGPGWHTKSAEVQARTEAYWKKVRRYLQ